MDERQLLNVVEEMAIASGVPVPPVYVIEDKAINAFAAGFTPSDAVIGVTRRCVDELDRDELQGVIAHEFSHILYGDMRLNLRLIGVLFGILLVSVTGRLILHASFYGRGRRSRSRGRISAGRGQLAILLLGVSLLIIGSIGVFFGRLIKSAISRQREFLADAAAVQFTRNPEGISSALAKIGNYASRIRSARAEEASHMFFASAVTSHFGGLLSTHPPIEERIRRIHPEFDLISAREEKRKRAEKRRREINETMNKENTGGDAQRNEALDVGGIAARVGMLGAAELSYAADIVGSIPKPVKRAARAPHCARAIIYCLLLSDDQKAFDTQRKYLHENTDQQTREAIEKLVKPVGQLPPEARLPVVELCHTALQQQDEGEYQVFRKTVAVLIAADNNVSIFEYALSQNLMRHLAPVFGKAETRRVKYYGIKRLIPVCVPLLALLAKYGNEEDPEQAEEDFKYGAAQLGADAEVGPMPEAEQDPVKTFDEALKQLREASGKVKKQILVACIAAVVGNGKVTVPEAELLRAVADGLDCPMPPLRPGKLEVDSSTTTE
ncbi:MAG: M48 family metallopeptidase [Planctomycetota bacterium]